MLKTIRLFMALFAAFSLSGCGLDVLLRSDFIKGEIAATKTKTSKEHYIVEDYATKKMTSHTRDVSFSQDLEATHKIKIGSQSYEIDYIEGLKLDPGGIEKLQLTSSNINGPGQHEILTIKNMSTQALEKKHQYKTEHVDLWYIARGDYYLHGENEQAFTGFEVGYADFGFKTESMRTAGSKLFKGGFAARKVRKSDLMLTDMLGKATFNVDFNIGNPTVTGKITDITLPISLNGNANGGNPEMEIYDGKISGTGFNAKIKYADIQNTPIAGTLSGSFYGNDAKEMGGSGLYSDATHLTTFGFTAK